MMTKADQKLILEKHITVTIMKAGGDMKKKWAKLFLPITFLLPLLSGCVGTTTMYSNVFDKAAQPATEFRVLYLENKLGSKQGAALPARNPMLSTIGYDDLPELFRERVPLVFGMNGLSAEVEAIKRTEFGKQEEQQTLAWSQKEGKNIPVLVLQIVDGNSITNTKYGSTVIYLRLHANMINPETKKRIWTGQFENTLSIALLGKVGFDNKFVDKMLKEILEQMAKDKMVTLPKGEALIPVEDSGKKAADKQKEAVPVSAI